MLDGTTLDSRERLRWIEVELEGRGDEAEEGGTEGKVGREEQLELDGLGGEVGEVGGQRGVRGEAEERHAPVQQILADQLRLDSGDPLAPRVRLEEAVLLQQRGHRGVRDRLAEVVRDGLRGERQRRRLLRRGRLVLSGGFREGGGPRGAGGGGGDCGVLAGPGFSLPYFQAVSGGEDLAAAVSEREELDEGVGGRGVAEGVGAEAEGALLVEALEDLDLDAAEPLVGLEALKVRDVEQVLSQGGEDDGAPVGSGGGHLGGEVLALSEEALLGHALLQRVDGEAIGAWRGVGVGGVVEAFGVDFGIIIVHES